MNDEQLPERPPRQGLLRIDRFLIKKENIQKTASYAVPRPESQFTSTLVPKTTHLCISLRILILSGSNRWFTRLNQSL